MHVALRFVLAALASWRLAFLVAREDGPGSICSRLRRGLGTSSLGKLLSCVKCAGVWIAIPFAWFVGGSWDELVVTWLALAGVTALIDEWTKPPFEWQQTTAQETTGHDVLRRDADRPPD